LLPGFLLAMLLVCLFVFFFLFVPYFNSGGMISYLPSFFFLLCLTVIHRVYLSSPNSGTGSSVGGSQLSGLPLLRKSESLETKDCIPCDPTGAPVPKYAMQAFSLLNESPKIQVLIHHSPLEYFFSPFA
jgi:hypothetical protein